MDLRLLRYFLAVAQELHFGRAAQRLFIAQPSLSKQIRKLEHDLGVALFLRDRHSVALTSAGRALLGPARRLLDDADRLPALARAAAGVGQLTIGYVPYARSHLLSGLLDTVRAAHPGLEITVRSGGDSPEVFAELRDGRVDAGILRTPLPAAPWLRSQTLTEEPFCVALPAGHALTTRQQVRLADLEPESFALFPRSVNAPAYDHLLGFFAEAGYAPTIGQASRRMDESLTFVASGGGVAVFPMSVAETNAEPGIVFRPLVDPTPMVEIVLAWDDHNLSPLLPDLVRSARRLHDASSPPVAPLPGGR